MNDIIDVWNSIEPPPAPKLQPVAIDPKSAALLVLDVQYNNCNTERRPRCVESITKIRDFILKARSKQMLLVYSLTSKADVGDIRKEVAPLPGELTVKSGVDKFYNTGLEAILREAGIESVVMVGTAAEGAVLHTASGAALRGLKVIIPVDGMSSSFPYAEQYTAWHLVNSPGTKKRTQLTRTGIISFL